tara:strand:- start:15 stop:539 length:525 start_codon:yes stop_codon:yes gene_type:complete
MATNQMDQLKRFNELKAKQARANATNKASDSGNVGQVGQPQKPTQAVRQGPTPRQLATPAQVAMHDRKRKAQRSAYESALKKHISQQKQQTVPKAPVGPPKRNFGIQKNLQPLPKSFRSSFGLPPKKRAGAITDMRGSAGLNQKGRKNSKQYSYSNGGLTRTTDKLKTGIKNGV